jgi:hypothetical protein
MRRSENGAMAAELALAFPAGLFLRWSKPCTFPASEAWARLRQPRCSLSVAGGVGVSSPPDPVVGSRVRVPSDGRPSGCRVRAGLASSRHPAVYPHKITRR